MKGFDKTKKILMVGISPIFVSLIKFVNQFFADN